jgi:hypothetical protein
MEQIKRSKLGGYTVLLATALMGCGDANVIGPENQLEVTNATDNFQFQVSALETVSETRTYDWENTGAQAKIDISQAITGGVAQLTISDADGTVLYDEDIAQDQDGDTPAGAPGTWRITVTLRDTAGTFNFRVQRVT